MAETITLDSIRDVSSREAGGVIVEATRVAIVEKNDASWPADATVMQTIYDLAGVPRPGDTFSSSHPDLIVTSRSLRMESPARGEVTVQYEFIPSRLNADSHFDTISSTLAQITTQRDKDELELIVTHDGRPQNGEISVLNPEDGFTRRVVVSVSPGNEMAIKTEWQAKINQSPWNNGEAGTWLCLKALPTPLDVRPTRSPWLFIYEFEFAYDATGWAPWVFWRDPSTGRPPDGLVADEGKKEVLWYDEKDFNVEPSGSVEGASTES